MLTTNLYATFLAAFVLLLTIDRAYAFPFVKRDLIEPDLGSHNCFEEKRDLIYPDLGAHNCEEREGRSYRNDCCGP